jgi:hypothetical protein
VLFPRSGSLITGHEKGSIVVWHGLTQFYLSAVSQAIRTRKAAAAASTSGATEEGSKSGKKHKKDKVNLCVACTTGTQSIVLVRLVSCVVICFVGASRFAYFRWMSRWSPPLCVVYCTEGAQEEARRFGIHGPPAATLHYAALARSCRYYTLLFSR